MPIYEYTCPSCRKVFEEWITSHDTAPRPCPDCGVMAPHIVSNTTFVLKGGGWYVTEYGNRKSGGESGSPATSAETPAAAASPAAAGAADSSGTGKAGAKEGGEPAPVPSAAGKAAGDAAASAA